MVEGVKMGMGMIGRLELTRGRGRRCGLRVKQGGKRMIGIRDKLVLTRERGRPNGSRVKQGR